MKKVLALVLALCLALSLAACGGSGSSSSTPAASGSGSEPAASTTPTAAGSVYYLNFKPEQDEPSGRTLAKALHRGDRRARQPSSPPPPANTRPTLTGRDGQEATPPRCSR